jgi:transposase
MAVSYQKREFQMSKRVKAIYTKEYRVQAVKLVLEEGLGVLDASKRLGMPLATLASWVTSAKAGQLSKVDSGRKVEVTAQEAEIKRLQKELVLVQMERNSQKSLKKATAYFARESLQSTRS